MVGGGPNLVDLSFIYYGLELFYCGSSKPPLSHHGGLVVRALSVACIGPGSNLLQGTWIFTCSRTPVDRSSALPTLGFVTP